MSTSTVTLSPVERAEFSLTKCQERLIKTKGREQVRNGLAELRLQKAQEQLRKAQERVALLEAKKAATADKMTAQVQKQTADVEKAKTNLGEIREKAEAKAQKAAERHSKKAEAEYKKAARTVLFKRVKVPAGVVTAEDSETRELTVDRVATVKRLIGRKKEGILSPLAGEAAQMLLFALEGRDGPRGIGFSVGSAFQLRIKGRKQTLYFEVVPVDTQDENNGGGVAWWTA